MGVICLASLKGGVGKTTLAVNLAAAFAERGCETALIDLDPVGHASRMFSRRGSSSPGALSSPEESRLAKLFLPTEAEEPANFRGSMLEYAQSSGIALLNRIRPNFSIVQSGPGLRHFLRGKGARQFKTLFPAFLEELRREFDYVIIDTAPDFNVLGRNAIAGSTIVVVPVDTSAMSIHCLEELIHAAAHIKGPVWSIVRTMVNRQASTVQRMSVARLTENLSVNSVASVEEEVEAEKETDDEDEQLGETYRDADKFISMFDRSARKRISHTSHHDFESPIYLLNSLVYRSEQQNKLSFQGKTAYDGKSSVKLAEQYSEVARELENLLSVTGGETEAESLPAADYGGTSDVENFASF